jgi:hypothetical protein
MAVQILTVSGCKQIIKITNKQFAALCAEYNKCYKLIDAIKETPCFKPIGASADVLNVLLQHFTAFKTDLDKTIDELVKRLRQAENYKKTHVILNPLTGMRMEHMASLIIYLREVSSEVEKIVLELKAIFEK